MVQIMIYDYDIMIWFIFQKIMVYLIENYSNIFVFLNSISTFLYIIHDQIMKILYVNNLFLKTNGIYIDKYYNQ